MRTVSPKNFFTELKRRNVVRPAILYVGAVWALAQGISQLGPSVGAPEWATRWFLVLRIHPGGLETRKRDRSGPVDEAPHRAQARPRDHRRIGGCGGVTAD